METVFGVNAGLDGWFDEVENATNYTKYYFVFSVVGNPSNRVDRE